MRSGGREGVTNRTDVRVCPDGGGECAKHGLKHRCCVLVPTGHGWSREISHSDPPPNHLAPNLQYCMPLRPIPPMPASLCTHPIFSLPSLRRGTNGRLQRTLERRAGMEMPGV